MSLRTPYALLPLALLAAAAAAAATARRARAAPPPRSTAISHWRMIGPFRGGRTRAVAGVPGSRTCSTSAPVNGGVWKTDDAGRTWHPIFDEQPTQSIGAIAVAPSDPNIIYVGSGEGLQRPDLSVGDGIYRSDRRRPDLDAPRPARRRSRSPSSRSIRAIRTASSPPCSATLRTQPERGVFRSLDGGATLAAGALQGREHRRLGRRDRSDRSRHRLRRAVGGAARARGRTRTSTRARAAGCSSRPTAARPGSSCTRACRRIWRRSTSPIAPSSPRRCTRRRHHRPGDYCRRPGRPLPLRRWRRELDAHHRRSRVRPAHRRRRPAGAARRSEEPGRASTSPSIVTMKSIDGGKTWTACAARPAAMTTRTCGSTRTIRRIIAARQRPGRGRSRSTAARPGAAGTTSRPRSSTTSASTPTFPYRVCGGQQESGSVVHRQPRQRRLGDDARLASGRRRSSTATSRPIRSTRTWSTAPAATKCPSTTGRTGQVQNVRRSRCAAPTIAPIAPSRSCSRRLDPHVLYYAANTLFRTTRRRPELADRSAPTWRARSRAVPAERRRAASPRAHEKQRGVIYALGTSPQTPTRSGPAPTTGWCGSPRDGGDALADVTPPALTPWSKVTQIEASHFDAATAYVSVSRLRIDDLRPYIYRTRDGGRSWQAIIARAARRCAGQRGARGSRARKGCCSRRPRRRVGVVRRRRRTGSRCSSTCRTPRCATSSIHGDDLIVGDARPLLLDPGRHLAAAAARRHGAARRDAAATRAPPGACGAAPGPTRRFRPTSPSAPTRRRARSSTTTCRGAARLTTLEIARCQRGAGAPLPQRRCRPT